MPRLGAENDRQANRQSQLSTPKACRQPQPLYTGVVRQINIADGFVDDCDELQRRCEPFEPLTFEKFTDLWIEMNIGSFYYLILILHLLGTYFCLGNGCIKSQINGDPIFKSSYEVPNNIEYGVETADNNLENPLSEEGNDEIQFVESDKTVANPSIFATGEGNIETDVATPDSVLFTKENTRHDPLISTTEKIYNDAEFLTTRNTAAEPEKVQKSESDADNPLFLTPYIEQRKIKEARRLAKVSYTKDNFNIISYSGFFTVDKKYNSNHFFLYFPPIEANYTKNPVVVWLEGGPGTSGMFSLFLENGPLAYDNGSIKYREYNWARQNHVVYIDNPVGVGFSFTNDSRGYCTNERQIGEHLYTTLSQFFTMFPELQANPLIISGVSYGGKFIPALAYTIHKKNPTASVKMNLKALHMGNPLIDPEHQIGFYNEILYNLGLLDCSQKQLVKEYEDEWLDDIKNKRWLDGAFKHIFFFDPEKGLFTNFTGYTNVYNFLHADREDHDKYAAVFDNSLRRQIHVGNLKFSLQNDIFDQLIEDLMKSMAPWVEELLPHYHLSLYTGNLDLLVGYASAENFLMHLDYSYEGSTYAEGKSQRTVGAEVAELSEEVIHIAKRYLVANTSRFEESVFGLFLVYTLMTMQPFKRFASLRLIPDDMPAIERIELVARREKRYDVLYILAQILVRGPVQFQATNREYGFEQALRKYHEGSTNIDNYGARPKGVLYRQSQELDIIKDIQSMAIQYEESKYQVRDDRGRIDLSLRYYDRLGPTRLDLTLRRTINGLHDDEIKTGDTEHRSERVRAIKDRAMSQKVDAMKHLTTTTDKKTKTPSPKTKKSRSKPDIVSKPEYNIEIDTMPIVIKGSVETNESQKIEIEFIDHFKTAKNPPEKTTEEKAKEVSKKMADLTEVSFTPVADRSARDQEEPQTTKNLNAQVSQVTPTEEVPKPQHSIPLKKPERREQKRTHLKSKMRKLGLEPLANFEETKKVKKKVGK
ncbi:serine carboxypeptidase domain-containing protein [Phthorimaea operculella]|nr:serine carboxypeptidase domain-containing protein [Phthorimaea operculella]